MWISSPLKLIAQGSSSDEQGLQQGQEMDSSMHVIE